MRRLILNKETLLSLTPDRLKGVGGAMMPETWTIDVCEIETRRNCRMVTEFPCNSVDTCAPQCLPNCQGGMSKPPLGTA
jgi:hypothetical protein